MHHVHATTLPRTHATSDTCAMEPAGPPAAPPTAHVDDAGGGDGGGGNGGYQKPPFSYCLPGQDLIVYFMQHPFKEWEQVRLPAIDAAHTMKMRVAKFPGTFTEHVIQERRAKPPGGIVERTVMWYSKQDVLPWDETVRFGDYEFGSPTMFVLYRYVSCSTDPFNDWQAEADAGFRLLHANVDADFVKNIDEHMRILVVDVQPESLQHGFWTEHIETTYDDCATDDDDDQDRYAF